MRIVVDTSALHSDPLFESPQSGLLLAAVAHNEKLEVVVPEVVVLEAVSMFRKRLEAALRDQSKLQREFRALGVPMEPPDHIELDAEVARYEDSLRRRLNDAGVRVPNPPDAAHLDIAKRAILRRKPFNEKGAGYRDTLIWLQVLEEADADEVVLVTANTRDFASDDENALAPDLVEDLSAAGLGGDRVQLVGSIKDVVETYVEPSATALTRMKALAVDERFRSQLAEAVAEAALYKEADAPEDEELSRLDVRTVEIDSVDDVRDVEIVNAYAAGDGAIAFNFTATMLAEADFYPYKYDIAGVDVPGVSVYDWDWNEWVVRAAKSLDFEVEGTAEYDPESETLRSVDVRFV